MQTVAADAIISRNKQKNSQLQIYKENSRKTKGKKNVLA